jgi:predicted nucleic acid-binding protein
MTWGATRCAAIVDAGPLVAALDKGDGDHRWAVGQVAELDAPLLLCEPVLVEAMYLLRHLPSAGDRLFGLIENGALLIAFHVEDHAPALRRLHQKYRDRLMSLADACIVRMAEIYDRHAVFTLDSDFMVYRKNGRTPIELICPPAG